MITISMTPETAEIVNRILTEQITNGFVTEAEEHKLWNVVNALLEE